MFLTGTGLSGKIPKALIMPWSHLDRAHLLIPSPGSAFLCSRFALFPSGCWEIPPLEFKWQLRVFFFPQNFKLLRELRAQSLCKANCMEITEIIPGLSDLPWHYQVAVLLCSLEGLHGSVMRWSEWANAASMVCEICFLSSDFIQQLKQGREEERRRMLSSSSTSNLISTSRIFEVVLNKCLKLHLK